MDIQARIPAALAAVHNFIVEYDWEDLKDFEYVIDENPGMIQVNESGFGDLSNGPASRREKSRAAVKRDEIAQAMWNSYQQLRQERGEDILE